MSREGLKLSLLENHNNNNNNGAPTLTTPTLTPTTLRNIEQMLLDSSEPPLACEPPELHENAAGFVPPSVELQDVEYDGQCSEKLQSSLDWVLNQPGDPGSHNNNNTMYTPPVPPVIASLIKDPCAAALPGPTNILLPLLSNLTPVSTTASTNLLPLSSGVSMLKTGLLANHQPDEDSPSHHPLDHSTSPVNTSITPSNVGSNPQCSGSKRRVLSGSSRRSSSESSQATLLTPEEKLKRDLRRERNKEAAARCRKRRLDQTLNLQDEVEELDSKKSSLQKELESLKAQRDELESLLSSHKSQLCSLGGGGGREVKKEPNSDMVIKSEYSSGESSSLACTVGGT